MTIQISGADGGRRDEPRSTEREKALWESGREAERIVGTQQR